LIKRRQPDTDLTIIEQNPADATFGFGVVFSDRALEFLREDDEETYAAIFPHMESWRDITLVHRGEQVVIDGVGFASIARLKLLQLLQARARSVSIAPVYGRVVRDFAGLGDADLIVGADGVNSLVRRSFERDFGATTHLLTNRFAWFGTSKRFETLTQTFVATELGSFNAHHYRYAPNLSTFIVEVDQATFTHAGFARMDETETRALCERVFAATLDGHPLVSNNSIWRQFPIVHNKRWSVGNIALIGDALHTAHFSIGSGTRLAMEDAIALDKVLAAHPDDIGTALAGYETARRPVLEKLLSGAKGSAVWYEHFAEHMHLPPVRFAMSYVMRSGRIDIDRLRRLSPRFVEQFERDRAGTA
jgi:2-polyprenyl-6-methoxyphenol hydroxylase-like FAD-dependent oxidoreductase